MGSEYNSTLRNQERLKEVSLDESSGIDTMITNMSKPSNVIVEQVVYTKPEVISEDVVSTITPVYDELPGVNVTIIPIGEKINKNNVISATINNLSDKQKSSIIFGLIVFSIILIAIAIFK